MRPKMKPASPKLSLLLLQYDTAPNTNAKIPKINIGMKQVTIAIMPKTKLAIPSPVCSDCGIISHPSVEIDDIHFFIPTITNKLAYLSSFVSKVCCPLIPKKYSSLVIV